MRRIDIKCGYHCNNRCRFCVQGDKRKTIGTRARESIIQDIKEARRRFDSIVFTGGEVTILKDFSSLVRIASSSGFSRIQVQSNGRMFSSINFCKAIIDAGANEFGLALHGSNAELHDFLTRTGESYRQTVQGIRNLVNLGQYVMTNTVITTYNYNDLPSIAGLLLKLGIHQYQFAFIHAIGEGKDNFEEIVPRYSIIEPYVKEGLQLGIDSNVTSMTEAIPYCFMKGYESHVAERIIPSTEISEKDHRIAEYREYRIQHGKLRGPDCTTCGYYRFCEGPWREYPEYYGWDEFKPVLSVSNEVSSC
jgi:MoaA/NifB/PqqE/SkfB family radical SAM enzyme